MLDVLRCLLSWENELLQAFDGQAILERMVPKPVQELEEEFKSYATAIVKQGFGITETTDSYQTNFLNKYNLPAALHATITEQELPEDLWQKVKMCKEQNANSGLKENLYNVSTFAANSGIKSNSLLETLSKEEEEDKTLRDKYGS